MPLPLGPQAGTFCIENYTGFPITNVTINHRTTDYKGSTLTIARMSPGTIEGNCEFTTDGGNKDRWTIQFTNNFGTPINGNENCGFEGNDVKGKVTNGKTSNGVVTIKLNPGEFDIVMPASQSCRGNDYNS